MQLHLEILQYPKSSILTTNTNTFFWVRDLIFNENRDSFIPRFFYLGWNLARIQANREWTVFFIKSSNLWIRKDDFSNKFLLIFLKISLISALTNFGIEKFVNSVRFYVFQNSAFQDSESHKRFLFSIHNYLTFP